MVISKMLGHAMRKGIIGRNVATLAEAPRASHKEQQVWTSEERMKFLVACRDDRLYPVWVMALSTGLRRGELAGLRWSDIDLERGALTVRATRVCVAYQVAESLPKTAKGRRTLALAPEVVSVLKAHRARQRRESPREW